MFLVFDIGGSKMRVASAHNLKKPDRIVTVRTPKNFKRAMAVFRMAVHEVTGGKKIKAAAGGIAGPFNRTRTAIVRSPNLSAWNGKPLAAALKRTVRAPLYLENDTALAGLGEAHFGAGTARGIMAYVTVSTGVGGVRIVDGRIDRSSYGFEIGHQIIMQREGMPRDLESYISGRALEKKYHKKPYEVTDKKIWDKFAAMLAIGLNNIMVYWSPDTIVLGGSMMKKIGIPIPRVKAHLKRTVTIFPHLPKIKKAELKDHGGLYGALAYLKGWGY